MPGVDDARTALTGISWGGYLTCIVAGLDKRFAAAVPVYGCGFLPDGSAWNGEFAKMSEEQRTRWIELWEPSRYLQSAAMPVFFVNGTNDFAYWLPSYRRTYELVANRTLRIEVEMKHGHQPGWAPQEIGLYVDSIVNGGFPLLSLGAPVAEDGSISLDVAEGPAIRSASLHFTIDDGPPKERKWQTKAATVEARKVAASVPAEASIYYLSVTDDRGAMVSSDLVFREP